MNFLNDPELQAFYSGILVAVASGILVIAIDYGKVKHRKPLQFFVVYGPFVTFAAVRTFTGQSFGRLIYLTLALFLVSMGVNRAAKKRGARLQAETMARYRAEADAQSAKAEAFMAKQIEWLEDRD